MYILPSDKGKRRSPYRGDPGFLRRFSYSPASDKLFYEHQVWSTFERTFGGVVSAKTETNILIGDRYNQSNFILAQKPASSLHEVIGESTVDYCFTDPPYSNDIHFLDLSTLWAAWLDLDITEEMRQAELIIGGTTKKSREQFILDFATSMQAVARVLKKDRWFTLVYKHRDLSLWQNIVAACEDSGLQYVNAAWQTVRIPSTRQIESPNTNPAGDMYLNFRKMSRRRSEQLYGASPILDLPTRPAYVEHEVERLIVSYLGADISLITSGVIQQVLDSRAFRSYREDPTDLNQDILKVLSTSRFTTWDASRRQNISTRVDPSVYQLEADEDQKMGSSTRGNEDIQWVMARDITLDPTLPLVDRARYYIFEFLRSKGEATEGEVLMQVLTRLAVEPPRQLAPLDVAVLLRSVAVKIEPHRWRFDPAKVIDYKQLRLLFWPSKADELREAVERRSVARADEAVDPPLRPDIEGITLLGDRLRAANGVNSHFEEQHGKLLEILDKVLGRLKSKFGSRIEQVLAVGDWAQYGVDLRSVPLEDMIIEIVLRSEERPFALYREIAEEVFTDLDDEEILLQFRLQTLSEWRRSGALARQRDQTDALGVPLLVRVW
jgi:hypothetical protein